ncbi:hypothetical protein GCM10023085_57220 [Actinomadura viridis]|uniref:Uncharacterized protein n=1 Tax=Actinomadura viridis TaxID=58110 RepID=A0A931DEH4_9ACTN|nr:hypothetical protein [Actinomadura viridis]
MTHHSSALDEHRRRRGGSRPGLSVRQGCEATRGRPSGIQTAARREYDIRLPGATHGPAARLTGASRHRLATLHGGGDGTAFGVTDNVLRRFLSDAADASRPAEWPGQRPGADHA